MDSWTLQGDSYSFLRSATHTFSLCHRDGTPNHIEIFDIINAPSQRSAISETTCLCDIFVDDCESPSLSSSPAVGPFVHPQREVNGTAAASPLVDDLNESSGSYHSAQGTSEGEDIFEDSRERLYSPPLQSESSEERSPDLKGLSSGQADITEHSKPNLEQKSKSPSPQFSTAIPSSEVLNSGERTPSPGHSIPYILSQDETASSSSSSSVEKGCSPPSPNPTQVHSGTYPKRITPILREGYTSLSHQSLTSSLSPEPRNGVNLSFDLVDSQSLPEFRISQVSPEPRSSHHNRQSSLLPEPTSKEFTLDLIELDFESRASLSSPSPSSSSTEFLLLSRKALVSPELKGSSFSPDTQASSHFPELRGRVSLPDILSRDSTPDIADSTYTPELISDLSTTRRDITATPESQGTGLSAVSTPAPRYTPPSPVISITTSPELVESCTSPELSHTAHSPDLLSAAFPAQTETRTPSPVPSHKIRHISKPSEIQIKVSSSPVLSHSVSPSPEVSSNNSPSEHSYSAPSPEIRITSSSPEVSRREQSSDVETTSASPLLEPDFDTSRSLASSPHITGISYSVIQPEDRRSPPFPELSHPSPPEAGRTPVYTGARSLTPSTDSIAESTAGTPLEYPHMLICTSSAVQPETILSNQSSSPQPKDHTASPEPRYQTVSSDKYQSFSPHTRGNDLSPVAPSPELRCHQQSSTNLNTENGPDTPLISTPGFEGESSSVIITEKQTKDRVSSPLELDRDKRVVPEVESRSPVVAATSPVTTSPFSVEEKVDNSPRQQSIQREAIPKEDNIQGNSSVVFSEEKQAIGPTLNQIEDIHNKRPIEVKSPSPNPLVSEDRIQSLSPSHGLPSKLLEHRPENLQPQAISYSPTPENSSSLKSSCASEHARRQLSTSVRRDNRERYTEDMAYHVNRRRTPSPPLTRFTPVHIIAPEKPHRHWQSRSHSSSQAAASSPSGHLKKALKNRESPNLVSVDNNSQANQGRLGTQLEMEREMQLDEDRKVGRERWMNRGAEREKTREEQLLEKGRGWQGDASYRGEQAELSFNARNRKGPVSRRVAPTSRDSRQGLPTAHSHPETLLATRQLQQQQSLLGLASQQDTRGGSSGRRLQPPAPQNKNSTPGLLAVNRPCQSSSSSMGSELDEADNEVKWFTDVAFSSLSSPEVDYLDMYNSSHRSSTNISQPSTQESSAGVNAAWMAYADFRGSAPKLDNDELVVQQTSAHFSDGLDPLRHLEMGSFECIDVAMEKEDSWKVRRGVPKRQIQLKRKDTTEGKQHGSGENSSPGTLMMMESPSLERDSRETFVRQHSTPAALQEFYNSECSPEHCQQNERKTRLQKSTSLDDTGNKTKMATCLIKSVLSKKMINVDTHPDDEEGEVSQTFEENSPGIENATTTLRESPKVDTNNLSSSLQSDYNSLSSDGLSVRGEPSAKDEAKPPSCFGVRSRNRPCSSSSSRSVNFSQTDSEEADSQSRNATSLRSGMSALKVPFDSKLSITGVQQPDDSEIWDAGDSANVTARNTGASSDTGASSMQARATNRDQECENTDGHKQLQQGDKGVRGSKKQEITFKAVEKKKASLNVCLTPEAENKHEDSSSDMSYREREQRIETHVHEKTEQEEGNVNNQAKVPIHKVRDVRQLVKHTYNLSFKATGAVMTSNTNEQRIGNINDDRGGESKEERREEGIAAAEREAMTEIGREERRQEKEDTVQVERKDEQKEEAKDSNLLTLAPTLRSTVSPQSRLQPMQIEYKAVCSKENKNETPCSLKDSDNLGDTLRTLKLATELNSESNTATVMSGHRDVKLTEEHEVPDNEDNPEVVGADRKPPMLGSLPRLPCKDREVSTAVVLIRDGSRKTKTTAPAAPEETPSRLQACAASPSLGLPKPGNTHARSGHSVSMLLKEKDYQADIGAVVGDNQNAAGGKGLTCKHVNCLEIPLQTTTTTDGGQIESQRERTFSSSSTTSGPLAGSDNTDTLTKTGGDEGTSIKCPIKDTAKQSSVSPLNNTLEQPSTHNKLRELSDFESVKRLDPTFPPKSPAIRRFRPQSIEVKSMSKDMQKQETPTTPTGNKRPQTIEVKSIAKNTQKPAVPPKPSGRFKPADLGAMLNEAQQKPSPMTSTVKPQGEERSQTIVVSSPTIYRKISNDSTSNYTRKLSVSTKSSLKPPPLKTTATTMPNLSHQSTAPPGTEASHDSGQQQKPETSPQSSSYMNRPTTLAIAPTSATCPGLTTALDPASEQKPYQLPGPASAGAYQPSQPAVRDPDSQPQHPRTSYPQEQPVPVTPNKTKQPPAAATTQVPGYKHQPCRRSFSSEHSHRTDDLRFYGSDDPPSYDERECFSPLMLPDFTPRRSNRYQPSSRPPPCSCPTGYPTHPGLTPPHHHRSPHNPTPPATSHSPGNALPFTVAPPPHRPHQCRSDPQQLSYQPGSPKSSPLGPSQPPTIYQPLHQPPPCPPHPSLMQPCPADRSLQPPQHVDSRRPQVHRSSQHHPPGMAPYNDPGHSHSPGLPSVDPQYLCGTQSLGPSYGSEYGGDSSSLYSETSYGQTPRRVLLDPETGKYFYIEVPVQPLRKMLFDPETGQYVEVIIPQQAMSHSGLYPPSAVPYPSLHNPNMYAPSPQYMPYAAPPPAHAQAQPQPQPPRYPETSAAPTMHPISPGVSYRNPSDQASKPESQNHPPLDQNYLESMYYVPTGLNASPNPTPPDYYHKHPPNLHPTGGKRS